MPKIKNDDKSEVKKLGIKPLMGYVLIESDLAENQTVSGIFLPESAQEKPAQGRVLAVGDNLVFDGRVFSSPVSVGQRVVYKKWGETEIKILGVEYKLVKFEDIMAILEE